MIKVIFALFVLGFSTNSLARVTSYSDPSKDHIMENRQSDGLLCTDCGRTNIPSHSIQTAPHRHRNLAHSLLSDQAGAKPASNSSKPGSH